MDHCARETGCGPGHDGLDRSPDGGGGIHYGTVTLHYHQRCLYPQILQCLGYRLDEIDDRGYQTGVDDGGVGPLLETELRCELMGAHDRDAEHLVDKVPDCLLVTRIADAHVTDDRQNIDLTAHRFDSGLGLIHIELLHGPPLEVQLCIDVSIVGDVHRVAELLSQNDESHAAALPLHDGIRGQSG